MEIYCKSCNKKTDHRQKGLRNTVNVCNECNITNMPITLIKKDSYSHYGNQVGFIEWSEDGRFKEKFDVPAIGRSCIIDPQSAPSYTWLTTAITEILESTSDTQLTTYQFKTENSEYTLYIYKNE
jgi:hypothetical protein